MEHFEFRIHGLQLAPNVLFVVTRNAESARAMAERIRSASQKAVHIDVWRARDYLFTVGQAALSQDYAQVQVIS